MLQYILSSSIFILFFSGWQIVKVLSSCRLLVGPCYRECGYNQVRKKRGGLAIIPGDRRYRHTPRKAYKAVRLCLAGLPPWMFSLSSIEHLLDPFKSLFKPLRLGQYDLHVPALV